MTRQQQYALVMAIRKAAGDKGLRQCDLARAAGTSDGNISSAFVLKHAMSDEKWRLICERVGVDFDAVMEEGAQPELLPCTGIPSDAVEVPFIPAEKAKPEVPAVEMAPVGFDPEECAIIAHLIEAHLIEDIISKSGVRFEWLEKVMGIREKCRRAAP